MHPAPSSYCDSIMSARRPWHTNGTQMRSSFLVTSLRVFKLGITYLALTGMTVTHQDCCKAEEILPYTSRSLFVKDLTRLRTLASQEQSASIISRGMNERDLSD